MQRTSPHLTTEHMQPSWSCTCADPYICLLIRSTFHIHYAASIVLGTRFAQRAREEVRHRKHITIIITVISADISLYKSMIGTVHITLNR